MMENKKVSEKKDSWLKVLLSYTEGSGQRLGISVILSVMLLISPSVKELFASVLLVPPLDAVPKPSCALLSLPINWFNISACSVPKLYSEIMSV